MSASRIPRGPKDDEFYFRRNVGERQGVTVRARDGEIGSHVAGSQFLVAGKGSGYPFARDSVPSGLAEEVVLRAQALLRLAADACGDDEGRDVRIRVSLN